MQLIRMPKSVFYLIISFWFFSQKNIGFCELTKTDSISDFIIEQEYKIWKASGTEKSNILLFELLDFYKKEKMWELGFKTIYRFDNSFLSYFERKEILVQKALFDLLLNYPEKAMEVCLSLERDSLTYSQKKRNTTIMLVSLIKTKDYRLSQTKLENYISSLADKESYFGLMEKYRQQVVSINSLNLKSVKKARKLSIFLPGAGLFYAGSPKRGIINIGLQIGAASYLAANIFFQNYGTAATFNLHWLRLFYIGAVNQSNDLVKIHNDILTHREETKLKETIFDIMNKKENP